MLGCVVAIYQNNNQTVKKVLVFRMWRHYMRGWRKHAHGRTVFKYTDSQRTAASARNFVTGLFGRPVVNKVWFPVPLKKDPVLRFYKNCNRWIKEVHKNPKAIEEKFLFINSTYVKKAIREVSDRLGFPQPISFEDLYLLYMTCSFESSWNKQKPSPWCATLSDESFKVMDYTEDLKFYWKDGYGFEISYKQACPVIRNFLNFFKSKETYPKAKFFFSHSGTLLKVLSHLGLYKDEEKLTHSNYAHNSNRAWKAGKIDAFGSNLAFVLFKCGNELKVLTLHQERPIKLPECDLLCDFENILKKYQQSVNDCNFDKICQN